MIAEASKVLKSTKFYLHAIAQIEVDLYEILVCTKLEQPALWVGILPFPTNFCLVHFHPLNINCACLQTNEVDVEEIDL